MRAVAAALHLRAAPLSEKHKHRWIATSWPTALRGWQAHFTASQPSDIETLIIQGEKDVVVKWEYNLPRIREKFRNHTVKMLPEANHHLVKESGEYRKQVFDTILEFL